MPVDNDSSGLDYLNKQYKEAIRKLEERTNVFLKSQMDIFKQQNEQAFRYHIDQLNQALELNDIPRAQFHSMNAQFYRSLLGLQ